MDESTQDREARFRRALAALRAGRLAEARLGWKALWDEEDDETHRTLLQALVQIVAALEKRATDPDAARKLLDLAAPKLASLPDAFGGVDLVRLREAVAKVSSGEAEGLEIVEASSPLPWSRRRPAPPVIPPLDRPKHFRSAMADYAQGRYFEAHERWEDLWRDEADPTHKNFLQALIQVAAAMHKLLVMGGTAGAIHLLGRAMLRLDGVADGYAGLAVELLVDDCRRARAEIERLAAEGRTDLSHPPRIEAKASD